MTLSKGGSSEANYLTHESFGGKVPTVNLRPNFADWNATDDFIFFTHVVNLVSLLPYGLKTTQMVIER